MMAELLSWDSPGKGVLSRPHLVTRSALCLMSPMMPRSSAPYNAQCSAECGISVHHCPLPQQPKESPCCSHNPKSC